MTINEYQYYSRIANKIFSYMNGNINRLNSNCTLCVDMYDLVNGTYASIRYPNFIFIHIGTIIDSWDPDWGMYMDKESYIVSVISWALSHELHHADQLISMVRYNANPSYKNSVEGDVERASYDWVFVHSNEIYRLTGVKICINEITSPTLPDYGNYTKATVEQFYKQTIANIVLRDLESFSKLEIFSNNSITDDIIINFNSIEQVAIKSNGKFIKENINAFSQLVYKYAGYFDVYRIKTDISINEVSGKRVGIVTFTIHDNYINPMIFKK